MQLYYAVLARQVIPEALQKHLKEKTAGILGSDKGGYWSIGSIFNGVNAIDYLAGAYGVPKNEQPLPNNPVVEEVSWEKEIKAVFNSTTFIKKTVECSWGQEKYTVHIVYNPEREALMADGLDGFVKWPLALTIAESSYLLNFVDRLKSIIPKVVLNDGESVIDLAVGYYFRKKYDNEIYTSIAPVMMSDSIENDKVDAKIQEVFASTKLTRKKIYYNLDNKLYKVLLIHNPEISTLVSTLWLNTSECGKISHTLRWSLKIGIFVDKVAPNELTNHIYSLAAPSWWDSIWNGVSLYNGDKVYAKEYRGDWQYTYFFGTKYHFMDFASVE